jgi:hypothetical protein
MSVSYSWSFFEILTYLGCHRIYAMVGTHPYCNRYVSDEGESFCFSADFTKIAKSDS